MKQDYYDYLNSWWTREIATVIEKRTRALPKRKASSQNLSHVGHCWTSYEKCVSVRVAPLEKKDAILGSKIHNTVITEECTS